MTGLSAMFMGKAVCFYSEFLLGLTRNEYRKMLRRPGEMLEI